MHTGLRQPPNHPSQQSHTLQLHETIVHLGLCLDPENKLGWLKGYSQTMEDSPIEINQYQGISHSVKFFFFCTVLTMEAMLLSLNGMNGWGEDHDKPNAEA